MAEHLRTYAQIAWLWVRAAWQYPTSFVLLAVGNGLITGLDFVGLWIMFAHLDQSDPQFGKIDQKNFVFNSGLMGVFEVGKA